MVTIGENCSKDISLQNVTPALHQMPLGFLVSRKRCSCLTGTFGELQIGLQLEEPTEG